MKTHAFTRLASAAAASVLLTAAPHAAVAQSPPEYSGAQLFRKYCASCHGRGGEGDGPVAPFFKLLPPDLTGLTRRSGGVFPAERTRRIIDGRDSVAPHGAREMPVWGMLFGLSAEDPGAQDTAAATQRRIGRLVEYLRTIQKNPAPRTDE